MLRNKALSICSKLKSSYLKVYLSVLSIGYQQHNISLKMVTASRKTNKSEETVFKLKATNAQVRYIPPDT